MQLVNNFILNLLARIQDARDESGQTLVEYALILALISVVAIVALGVLGKEVTAVFEDITDTFPGGTP